MEWRRIIDYFLCSNDLYDGSYTQVLDVRVSDHKVVTHSFPLSYTPEVEYSFKKQHEYKRPHWIGSSHWKELLTKAYAQGQHEGWSEACRMIDRLHPEHSTYDEQQMCDFAWQLAMMKLIWAHREAYRRALMSSMC